MGANEGRIGAFAFQVSLLMIMMEKLALTYKVFYMDILWSSDYGYYCSHHHQSVSVSQASP